MYWSSQVHGNRVEQCYTGHGGGREGEWLFNRYRASDFHDKFWRCFTKKMWKYLRLLNYTLKKWLSWQILCHFKSHFKKLKGKLTFEKIRAVAFMTTCNWLKTGKEQRSMYCRKSCAPLLAWPLTSHAVF